mmetsp:Transcript_40465/g.86194  ORF Transcript_40465/g.86194 Transcript_40465/m.86194 type:complete len:536 (-) Transcript_40465:375-1982(-)
MSSSQRVTRSFQAAGTTPSFSVGTTATATTSSATTSESPGGPVSRPRSTRRAAVRASTRIAAEAGMQRRSTRLPRGMGRGAGIAASPAARRAAPRGTTKEPIVLDDEEIDEMDLKPAAKPVAGGVIVTSPEVGKPPADFTCAICLDAPSSMTEVASISGCTHRFCFDCIGKWAETENRCPCCKERFRTIERVAPLPPAVPEATATGRRGKRTKAPASGRNTRARRGGSGASLSPARRVNSRTVEDRNQQSLSTFPINAAIVEQILASFSSIGGPLRGAGQVTFGTSEDGRPAIRMIRPASGGMVGVMEMLLPDDLATGGNGGTAAAAGGSARVSGAVARGRGSSPTRSPRVRFSTQPAGGSTRGSSSAAGGGGGPPSVSVRLMETASNIAAAAGSANGSSRVASGATRPASAGSGRASSAGSRVGGSRAARQGGSIFSNVFSSLGGSSSMRSPQSGRSRRSAAAGSSPAGGAAGSASVGSGPRNNRMTIRIIARDRAASSSGRPTNRRTTGGVSSTNGGTSGSGSSDPNEPIVID